MDAEQWQARAQAHAARVDAFTEPHLARRREGEKHPVHDFLFTYYSQSPAKLRRWHPGFGIALEDAAERADWRGYALDGRAHAEVTTAFVASQRVLLTTLARLLRATAGRAPSYGCFGLHEWAMVYRLGEDETRHADWPLRLGDAGTDAVVESNRIACSHFDAYRFFTEPARPRNALSPGPEDREAHEQPGCLHAGMDLYKHAYRLSPMVASELVMDCFELAWEIRAVDMRAAPYDLAALGFEPIPVETPEGKRAYVAAQAGFAERAAGLRARLLEECERLLATAGKPERAYPETEVDGLAALTDSGR